MSQEQNGYINYTKLDTNINTIYTEGTPYISKDGSFLIFTSAGRDDGIGMMDLYISFKNEDGSWTKARNMGEPINLPGQITRFPRMSPDGKYLFYWCNVKNEKSVIDSLSPVEKGLRVYKPYRPEDKKDGDIYWVDAKIIEQLKAK
jgi:hypothetical protein